MGVLQFPHDYKFVKQKGGATMSSRKIQSTPMGKRKKERKWKPIKKENKQKQRKSLEGIQTGFFVTLTASIMSLSASFT